MKIKVEYAPCAEPKEFNWQPNEFVGVAVSRARHDFGAPEGEAYHFILDGVVVASAQTLVAAGIVPGSHVELVAIGGSV